MPSGSVHSCPIAWIASQQFEPFQRARSGVDVDDPNPSAVHFARARHHLAVADGLTLGQLGAYLGLSRATVRRMCDWAEGNGLITMKPERVNLEGPLSYIVRLS